MQQEGEAFSFDKPTFDQLASLISQQEQRQSISVSLLKLVVQLTELARKSARLLKELGREWKSSRRSYYIQHLNTVRIAVFLNCLLGQSHFIQFKTFQSKLSKLPETELSKIKTLKRTRFTSLQELTAELRTVWKLEGADHNLVKNLFTLMFVFIREF